MRYLIIGGCGFIGTNLLYYLCRHSLVDDDFKVVVVDKLKRARDLDNIRPLIADGHVTFVKSHILDTSVMKDLVKHADVVINLAFDPLDSDSVSGTPFLMRLSKDQVFIHISSGAVYKPRDRWSDYPNELEPGLPSDRHSMIRLMGDLLALETSRALRVPLLVLRLPVVFGPFQYPNKFLPFVICSAISNSVIKIPKRESKIVGMDYLYVMDAASAIKKAAAWALRHRETQIFNVSSSSGHYYRCLCNRACSETGTEISQDRNTPPRSYESYQVMDGTNFRQTVKWEPAFNVEETIPHVVKWYMRNRSWWGKAEHQKWWNRAMNGKLALRDE
jgi:dTDP-glucose 4,6-dehydratase